MWKTLGLPLVVHSARLMMSAGVENKLIIMPTQLYKSDIELYN
jgi:hypothetical protein